MAYNMDEIRSFIISYNPGANYGTFQDIADNLSIEDLLARRS